MTLNQYLAKYEPLNGKVIRCKGKRYRVHIKGANIIYPYKAFQWTGDIEELDTFNAYRFASLTDGDTFMHWSARLDRELAKCNNQ